MLRVPTHNRAQYGLRIQPRDVELLRLLLDHFGVLTRQQICDLFPGRGVRRTNRRLRKLIAAGFLSRRNPFGYFVERIPLYFLGPCAFDALSIEPTDARLAARRKQAAHLRDRALPHFLLTNEVHIKFLTAEREYPDYQLLSCIPGDDSLWNELNQYGFPLRPDAYLEYRKDSLHFCAFIELDRSTERAPRLHDKLAAYNDYAASGRFRDQFAAEHFRVLFIVPTTRRRHYLLRALKQYRAGLFFTSSYEDFFSRSIFEPYWISNASENLLSLSTPQ